MASSKVHGLAKRKRRAIIETGSPDVPEGVVCALLFNDSVVVMRRTQSGVTRVFEIPPDTFAVDVHHISLWWQYADITPAFWNGKRIPCPNACFDEDGEQIDDFPFGEVPAEYLDR